MKRPVFINLAVDRSNARGHETLYDCCVYSCFYSMKMVCFVSSRTLRKKHIVTCFFLPKGKPLLRDGQNKHFHVRNS